MQEVVSRACQFIRLFPHSHVDVSVQVYALGPSTKQAIVSRGYPLTGVAARPDPASLLEVLQQVRYAYCTIVVVNSFYVTLFSAFKQTHCAHM